MVPGSNVRATGSGKIASKSVWLFRKLAGPTNVNTGFAPGVKRRSSLETGGGGDHSTRLHWDAVEQVLGFHRSLGVGRIGVE